MNWTYLAFAAIAIYVASRWASDYFTAKRISEAFRKDLDRQIELYDKKIAEETKAATEAVNEANKSHDEYMAKYYAGKSTNGSGDSGTLPPAS